MRSGYIQFRPYDYKSLNFLRGRILRYLDQNDLRVLDLFAGEASIVGFFFTMRIMDRISYYFCVEKDRKRSLTCSKVMEKFHLQGRSINADVFRLALKEKFNLIFIDPPYMYNMHLRSLELVKKFAEPNCCIVVRHNSEFIVPSDFSTLDYKQCGNSFVYILKFTGC